MAEKKDLTGIILGAGRGERMGGPKALLVIEGEPLYLRHVRRARLAGCGDVILVTNREVARELPPEPGLRIVLSDEDETSGSVARGCTALGDAVVVLLTPVDVLPATTRTIELLFQAIRDGAEAATPSFHGRGGHPVLCRREVLSAYVAAPPFPTLRDALARLGEKRVRVEVTDPHVTRDLNRPDDIRALTGAAPQFWKKSMLP